jgi:hypothetical protein
MTIQHHVRPLRAETQYIWQLRGQCGACAALLRLTTYLERFVLKSNTM